MRFFKALAAAVAVCPATLVALVVPHSVIYGGPANESPVRHAVMSHTLPDLPYAYDALEPYISRQIMELHHKKHHQAYVNGLNAAEASYAKAATVRERIALQSAIKFNGGGDINHSLFWKNLAPARSAGKGNGGILKEGKLKDAIVSTFGSVDSFIKEFNAATAAIQGSGWGWLGFDPKTGSLEITTTPNQDPLLSHLPILGVDIWEHAFYLQYLNVKADYLNSIWSVINWEEAEKRYNEGLTAPKPCIACSHIIPQSQPN